ncbi:MAG: carboxypeptidase-like regulatory domain-containing protein [Muribaculaceae bacterium]|nr:carboxypeptidase-like regulatory domain-containing protein [Muribaculaceae bacterium]
MHKYNIYFLVILLLSPILAMGQPWTIKGTVINAENNEKVPYAAIFVVGTKTGYMANENGEFEIKHNKRTAKIKISSIGYENKEVNISLPIDSILKITLNPQENLLEEVIVTKKREKYSKKNNPAVTFVNKIRSLKEENDPHRNEFYNYDKYEKITLGLNNFAEQTKDKGILAQFKFLNEYIDTSEVSGKPILNVSVKEKASQIIYRKNPKAKKEYVTGIKRNGIDDITDQESMQVFLEDIFREIDLYENDINILQNRFVSPLSKIAPDFYKFYLTDTVMIDSQRCIQLAFAPHNSATFGFVGYVYVPEGDSTMFIKKVSMKIPSSINLNFIDHMFINQEFIKAEDGSRLKIKDDMVMEISVLPGAQGLYARRNTSYSNHNFTPSQHQHLFDDDRKSIIADDAYIQDDTYWNGIRTSPITKNEEKVGSLLSQLRDVPLYYWTEKILRILVSGYIHTTPESKIDIGPMNTLISNNDVEGWRFRVGGITTANLNKRLFARGFVAYGTKDKKIKYSGELEYSFINKKYHSREFPVQSLRLTHLYDVDQLGQQYAFTNKDNIFLSLKRHEDNLMTYHRYTNLEYILELHNNFSLVAGLSHDRQEATKYVPFVDGYNNTYNHYNQSSLKIKLRYAPGEKFYQSKTHRYPINLDAPIFELTHTYSPKNFLGSMFEINKTEFSAQKRFWFSAFGFADCILKGGHVWSKAPYPNLLLANANLSYTIQPESFALMNPLEFINDSYVSWDVTYWANGALLNYIPLLKKLKLREAFSFRGLYGHLSDKNDPTKSLELFKFPETAQPFKMTSTPYMEVGVGVDNLFKILRVDYVWRLTYRNNPNIDKSGIRIALHITF